MQSQEIEKKIPTRNYLIYFLLLILIVVVTFYLRNWYQVRKDLTKEKTIMSDFLVDINEEEFANYIVENNNFIIYLASSTDEKLKEFEEKFKEKLIDYSLQDQTIFIDLNQVNDEFIDVLKNNYLKENLKNLEFSTFTNIMIVENGKISAVLYNNKTDININDVDEFFYSRGVIGQA